MSGDTESLAKEGWEAWLAQPQAEQQEELWEEPRWP
jgi:hypothetical protein